MLNTIVSAIRNRHTLTFTYGGIQRTVEPHVVGVSRMGNDVMRCYQIGENIPEGQEWLLCELGKISGLTDTGASFSGARPDYNKWDKDMLRAYIYAQL
ncbi:MAG: hypothetical protein Q7J38_17005 [Gallionella sp.]|nr:hypothetical protein [Gallionella sp.]